MAQLVVRGLDDDIKRRLQKRAEVRKHSLEAEVREILRAAALAPASPAAPLGSRIARRFAGLGLTEAVPELRGEAARPAQFGE
ncbi:MAG TPA: plasmid stabilization protein [Acidisoma sp.]|uniref:FitA-like ribbon-helix-helix domain-containing protein n=1 Tax=Acidisoma sp. TaxID=1872115 RepID=UPI002CE4540C|nr:plasmid stabilization protein [Acidisoma sp.]HTI02401.1 plasmid stabilization protein [Acidisoma sp.]